MNFDSNVVHIVYASYDKFAEILGVSLSSLYENSNDMDDIVVHILDSGIKDDNKDKLLLISRRYERADIKFVPAKDISKKLEMRVATDCGGLSQYAKLFVSSDLPENLCRVLYLDYDIIIKESIQNL